MRSAPFLVTLFTLANASFGQPPSPTVPDVPEALRPWIGWVLHGQESKLCPLRDGDSEEAANDCRFLSELVLSLDDRGGRFTLKGELFAKAFVTLPHGEAAWPLDVKAGTGPARVVAVEGVPALELPAGPFTVSGTFSWEELPESLALPKETAVVALTLRGKEVPSPALSDSGELLLQRTSTVTKEEERAELRVQRLVEDDIPLRLVTRITLEVAGKTRELTLGRVLPRGFIPLRVDSPLPQRLMPDGHLRVQVRPGHFELEVAARQEVPSDALSRPDPEGPWASGDEVWAFRAEPALRRVNVEGVSSVDPQQTTLPEAWKGLPAYAMSLKDMMRLDPKRRGDEDPTPDQLALERRLWLDFNGQGYTAQDHVTGALTKSWRLDTAVPGELGRVALNGRDQLITHRGGEGTGVELRQGHIDLVADSRWSGGVTDLSAVGFAHDFSGVHATLQLPPGWRLFGASGVDQAPRSWLHEWSLLDFFLVLILAIGAARLFGLWAGVLAGVTFVLTFPEADAPKFTWLTVLATHALVQVLPAGRLQWAARAARGIAALVLGLVALPFIVTHVRGAVYPALENEEVSRSVGFGMGDLAPPGRAAPEPVATSSPAAPPADEDFDKAFSGDEKEEGDGEGFKKKNQKEMLRRQAIRVLGSSNVGGASESRSVLDALDTKAVVQTGPGVPSWSWTSVELKWNGPVEQSQRLHLYLMPPWLNLLLAFLRAGLLIALAVRVLGGALKGWPPSFLRRAGASAGVAALLGVLLAAPSAHADMPSPELLSELRQRLTEAPKCAPNCASTGRMVLSAKGQSLTLSLEVSASAAVSVPLPGSREQWTPRTVKVDGVVATALERDAAGLLRVALKPGAHVLVLEGPLPARDTVQLALPLPPHSAKAQLDGWHVEGIHDDGTVDETLQLSRSAKAAEEAGGTLQPLPLPSYVEVQRTLELGLTWEVMTQVHRLDAADQAVVLEVPLLEGESVTSKDVRVVNGRVQVNLAPASTNFGWHSVLGPRSALVLKAASGVPYREVWTLVASPLWHVERSGIPATHPDPNESHAPTWRPYPGEKLTLDITRPEGAGGQSLTIDQSDVVVRPGLRATDVDLTVSLRSSRGGQHVLTLPEGAELQSLKINGRVESIRQEGRDVAIPLSPGAEKVELTFREPRALSVLFRAPEVRLNAPSVNANVTFSLPNEWWILAAHGPELGPAVLYWGAVLGVLIAAFFLSRVRTTPLGFGAWALLGLGLAQLPYWVSGVVAGWFLVIGWRGGKADQLGRLRFNALQLLLAVWALVAAGIFIVALEQGLAGIPDMQIVGNGSYGATLRWFTDRVSSELPRPFVVSVPLYIYRGVMLLWALWLAQSLLRWLPWAWRNLSESTLWKPKPKPPPKTTVAVATVIADAPPRP